MGVPAIKTGFLLGTGATLNVECGFIPDIVILNNLTDSDQINIGYPSTRAIAFTSGGTTPIVAGMTIRGATSTGVRAKIRQVILVSGTFAGGDAAGFFLCNEEDCIGNFGSENVVIVGTSGTDDATVTAGTNRNVAINTAVAAATGTSAIAAYAGSRGSASKGFTIGSVISESGKLLQWTAFRDVL